MPKVSIIIPAYNSSKFIDRTIQSVLDQTYKDWELIIVDDLSKDNTRDKILHWSQKDSRIKYIFLDKNSGGPAHPKNIAFTKTTGKYIAYLDHDDEWLPEKLQTQIDILESDSSIGMISCEGITVDENGKEIDRAKIKEIPEEGVFPSILYTDYISSNSSIVLPREVIEKVGGRDVSPDIGIAEDREFEMRVATNSYKLFVIHKPLFIYRMHTNNTSKSGNIQGLKYANANMKYIDTYKKYHMEHLVYNRFAREYLKIGDISKARNYCRMALSKKIDMSLLALYMFLFIGNNGIKVVKNILNIRTKILYR